MSFVSKAQVSFVVTKESKWEHNLPDTLYGVVEYYVCKKRTTSGSNYDMWLSEVPNQGNPAIFYKKKSAPAVRIKDKITGEISIFTAKGKINRDLWYSFIPYNNMEKQ